MRKCRILRKGATYHVTAKINRGLFELKNEAIKKEFLKTVGRAKQKYSFYLRNFCLMHNHIHFLIEPVGNENLSRIMQWILSVFAMKFNKTMDIHGHVWQDRFHSRILDNISQILAVFEYITQNPVKAGIVNHPFLFKFNGINYLRNKNFKILEEPLDIFRPFIKSLYAPAA